MNQPQVTEGTLVRRHIDNKPDDERVLAIQSKRKAHYFTPTLDGSRGLQSGKAPLEFPTCFGPKNNHGNKSRNDPFDGYIAFANGYRFHDHIDFGKHDQCFQPMFLWCLILGRANVKTDVQCETKMTSDRIRSLAFLWR